MATSQILAEAINTSYYICHRCLVRPIIGKKAYEIYFSQVLNISHLKDFCSRCSILNTKDQLHKFDAKFPTSLLFGYAFNDYCYKIYNLKTNVIKESINVVFDEVKPNKELVIDYDVDDDIVSIKTQTQEETNVEEIHKDKEIEFHKDHPKEHVISSPFTIEGSPN